MNRIGVSSSGEQVIIEAQQRIINTDPHRKEMLTSADLGPTRMRLVIDELIKAESGPPIAVATQ